MCCSGLSFNITVLRLVKFKFETKGNLIIIIIIIGTANYDQIESIINHPLLHHLPNCPYFTACPNPFFRFTIFSYSIFLKSSFCTSSEWRTMFFIFFFSAVTGSSVSSSKLHMPFVLEVLFSWRAFSFLLGAIWVLTTIRRRTLAPFLQIHHPIFGTASCLATWQ